MAPPQPHVHLLQSSPMSTIRTLLIHAPGLKNLPCDTFKLQVVALPTYRGGPTWHRHRPKLSMPRGEAHICIRGSAALIARGAKTQPRTDRAIAKRGGWQAWRLRAPECSGRLLTGNVMNYIYRSKGGSALHSIGFFFPFPAKSWEVSILKASWPNPYNKLQSELVFG